MQAAWLSVLLLLIHDVRMITIKAISSSDNKKVAASKNDENESSSSNSSLGSCNVTRFGEIPTI